MCSGAPPRLNLKGNRRWWLITATGGVALVFSLSLGVRFVGERTPTSLEAAKPPQPEARSAHSERPAPLPPQPMADPAAPAASPTMPAIDLAATTAAGTNAAAALVRSRADLREEWVREGEWVSAAPGVRLVEVGSDHAVFSSGADQFTLWAHTNAMPAFATEMEAGNVVGARVLAAPDGSVVAALGLRAGDVILALNGLPVSSRPQELAEALRGAPSLRLRLRAGDGEVREVQLSPNPAYGKQF
jgi:membrane-associated protease RseP (regulator of RpoE activity)